MTEQTIRDHVQAVQRAHDPTGQVNLRGYAATMATYVTVVATALLAGRRAGVAPPARTSAVDVLVGGVATHKLSRLLAKGSVASPLRAPFTEFEAAAGPAEHRDRARGSGTRRTIGELLTCPFCLAVWLGTAYLGGLTVAPRLTRSAAAMLSVVAISDWLQLGHEAARRAAED